MMAFRSRKKFFPESGLVKKSAMFACVLTKGTTTRFSSTSSRMKKWRRSTCFTRSWC